MKTYIRSKRHNNLNTKTKKKQKKKKKNKNKKKKKKKKKKNLLGLLESAIVLQTSTFNGQTSLTGLSVL